MTTAAYVLSVLPYVLSFLFLTRNSECACAPCIPPAPCSTGPTCPPVQRCSAAIPECCDTGECKKTKRLKRAETFANGFYVVELEIVHGMDKKRSIREKRDTRDDVVKVDAKCNSEDLRTIIIENVDPSSAVSKREILTEAERRLNGRYNVICARADLSYITNTEEFCQQTVGDVTCLVFKQLSDTIRANLA